MKMKVILAMLLCSYTLTSIVVAEEQPRIISVQGSATIATVPDAFSVTFVIEQKGESVSTLNQRVSQSTKDIIDLLRGMSVDEKNIQTMQIQLNPWYEGYQKERRQRGFVLKRTISVSHKQLDQYDALVDGVLQKGANRIEKFSFVVLNQQKLYQQALSAAMLDAERKALQLLQPIGAELGVVQSVNEHQGYSQPRGRMLMADAEGSSALPGVQSVNASVSVSFLIN